MNIQSIRNKVLAARADTVAAETGLSRATIYRFREGSKGLPTMENMLTLEKWANKKKRKPVRARAKS